MSANDERPQYRYVRETNLRDFVQNLNEYAEDGYSPIWETYKVAMSEGREYSVILIRFYTPTLRANSDPLNQRLTVSEFESQIENLRETAQRGDYRVVVHPQAYEDLTGAVPSRYVGSPEIPVTANAGTNFFLGTTISTVS